MSNNSVGCNLFVYCLNSPINYSDSLGLCAKAWAAGYQGPCPGPGKPGCMDNYNTSSITAIDPNSPPDHPDYIPPKKGGSQKVRNPNGKGWGWPAKDSGVWMRDPKIHGGEGWTIQYPGGGHSHAYPGGGIRNHFKFEQSRTESMVMIFEGFALAVIVIGDDALGIVEDDPLLATATACMVGGIDGLFGKKVCTKCGGVKYGY